MDTSDGKQILDSFSTNDLKRGWEAVLPFFIHDHDIRGSVARTLRIEMTRKSTQVPVNKRDLQILSHLLHDRKNAIIDAIAQKTCIQKNREKNKDAEAIVARITSLIDAAMKRDHIKPSEDAINVEKHNLPIGNDKRLKVTASGDIYHIKIYDKSGKVEEEIRCARCILDRQGTKVTIQIYTKIDDQVPSRSYSIHE